MFLFFFINSCILDTDNNHLITIDDKGPKVFALPTVKSNGNETIEIRGTYMLSNLLQELTLAKEQGLTKTTLDGSLIDENPVSRLSRLIKDRFWDALTRKIDRDMINTIAYDEKSREKPHPRPRIYVPRSVPFQFEYYTKIAKDHPEIGLDVVYLPENITPEWVRSIALKPGLLALEMDQDVSKIDPETGKPKLFGVPYIVPGGRFNELYGWDSYMESLGLIVNGRVDLAKGMLRNFIFEIQNYGKILNANRSYYLCRSQPPFLTDMALRVYEQIQNEPGAKDLLKQAFVSAIKEYHTVWMAEPRLDKKTGLSRYRPDGLGFPLETEESHFNHLLKPFAKKYNTTVNELIRLYNEDKIIEPEIDEYLLHDRAVRESGHDSSYRIEGVCADLATVDLNFLLYKYESDIADTIDKYFNGKLELPDRTIENSTVWKQRMANRREVVTKYLWNEKRGLFFDYNTKQGKQTGFETATIFWALYSGIATSDQAEKLVRSAIPLFEKAGGIVSGTEKSRGDISALRPARQWDYPFGWAPQQMPAWIGLLKYGYTDIVQRLVYRWLYMMTRTFVNFNGVVVEKYNVTSETHPHLADVEYGNQGGSFKGVAKEGFGWANSSYVFGLSLLNKENTESLRKLKSPREVFEQL